MRLIAVVIFMSLLALTLRAGQEEARNPQVDAATADALESLKREILCAHVTPAMTVEDLLNQVGGTAELDKVLRDSQQLGGARWLGDQAVQVRLSIDGARVGKALGEIVRAHAKHSPISPGELDRHLRPWADRTFSATGTSTGAADFTRLRPAASDRAWSAVSDADRKAALVAARNDAIAHVLENLNSLDVDGKSLAPALTAPEVSGPLKTWLAGQPVKAVEFRDDLSVGLTLSAPADELWPVLRSALSQQKEIPLPADQAQWDRLHAQLAAHLAPAVGIGNVGSKAPIAPAVALPAQAPQWSIQNAEAEATSPDDGARLRTARRAEALALEKLRHQLEALPLADGMTVGDAAQRDPVLKKALTHALNRARPIQVDYGAKGSVTVHISLRLSDLWADLTGQQ
jgi:hypothetical protein